MLGDAAPQSDDAAGLAHFAAGRATEVRLVHYDLRIATEEPQRRIELVHTNLRRFGTVYNTLASVCDVSGTITAVPTTQSTSHHRARAAPPA